MVVALFALLMPLVLAAQVTLEPRRLDDSLAFNFFYPTIDCEQNGTLLCTWAGVSETTVGSYGQPVAHSGDFSGGRRIFDEANPETYLCPPELFRVHTASGGEMAMIFHS